MDLRIQKTRAAIKSAFLELRRKKPIEKITVTELAKLAEINKATFYLHYSDIYSLADEMEDEVIEVSWLSDSVSAGISVSCWLTRPSVVLASSVSFLPSAVKS